MRRYLHLLLVEDHRHAAESLATILRLDGHYVTVAGTVAGALAAAAAARRANHDVDLALVDLQLPDGDGAELLEALARQHGLRGISMSALDPALATRRSRAAGFLSHLPKPVDVRALERLIQQTAHAA